MINLNSNSTYSIADVDMKAYISAWIPEEALEIVEASLEAKIRKKKYPIDRKMLLREIKDVDGLLCFVTDKIDSGVVSAARKMKVISNCAVGVDNIDIEAATKKGIFVTNTPDILTETTADLTWALLMSLARRITEAEKYIKMGKWKYWHLLLMAGTDIYGKTLGIVGLGRIGTAVARRAQCFGMKILYYDAVRNPELEEKLHLEFADLETMLKKSDYVTLHVPLMKQTYHLIGERELSCMKPSAFLINASRGAIIDEKALVAILKEKKIAGAALDVFEKEPINKNHPLLKFSNVIVVPHIGSATVETRTRMVMMAAENLVKVLNGKMPHSLVNHELLKNKPLIKE